MFYNTFLTFLTSICNIGVASYFSLGGAASWTLKFPVCSVEDLDLHSVCFIRVTNCSIRVSCSFTRVGTKNDKEHSKNCFLIIRIPPLNYSNFF